MFTVYGKDMVKAVERDTDGDFRKLCVTLISVRLDRACILRSNHTYFFAWDAITNPRQKFHVDLTKPPLKFGDGLVVTSHYLMRM